MEARRSQAPPQTADKEFRNACVSISLVRIRTTFIASSSWRSSAPASPSGREAARRLHVGRSYGVGRTASCSEFPLCLSACCAADIRPSAYDIPWFQRDGTVIKAEDDKKPRTEAACRLSPQPEGAGGLPHSRSTAKYFSVPGFGAWCFVRKPGRFCWPGDVSVFLWLVYLLAAKGAGTDRNSCEGFVNSSQMSFGKGSPVTGWSSVGRSSGGRKSFSPALLFSFCQG